MHALVLVGLLAVAAPSDKPVGAKGAIKKADKIASVITKRFDPSSDAYKRILETMRTAGNLARPLKMSVAITSVNLTDKGSISVVGSFRARKNNVGVYFTNEDRIAIEKFRRETESMDDKYKKEVRARVVYRTHRHAHDGVFLQNDGVNYMSRQWSEEDREYNKKSRYRRKADTDLIRSISEQAAPRQTAFENIYVDVIIPPALAEHINIAKLANAKRVLLTIDVQRFGLQQPIEEIGLPAAIGSITGTAVTITKSFLKKK